MYKSIAIIISVLSFISAKAQYGDAYHAPNTQALQRETEKRQQATSDAHNKSVAPGSNGASNYSGGSVKVNWPTKEEREAEAAKVAAANKMHEEAWAYQLKRKQESKAFEEKRARSEATVKQQEKNNYVTTYVAQFSKSFLNKTDVNELAQINYFHQKVNNYFNQSEYMDANKALSNFKKDSATATLDTLANQMWRAKVYPFTSSECLQTLRRRFPTQKKYIEQLELEMMCYYFGGHDPYLDPVIGVNYPTSSLELMDELQKNYSTGLMN